MANSPKEIKVFDHKHWVSKSEAARLRGVSRQAIWELVKRGRLIPAVYGRRMYLRRSDVINFKQLKNHPASSVDVIRNLNRNRLDPAKWLSMTEASRALGVTHQVVSALVRRGRLRGLRVNGKTLLLRSTIEKFKAEQPAPNPSFFPKSELKYDRKAKYRP